MKKFLIGFAALIVMACVAIVSALEDIPLPTDGSLYEGPVHEAARTALAATLRSEMEARTDTNLVVAITTYTPRYVGDILVAPSSTNAATAWLAVGSTTNDWSVLIAVE